MVEVGRAPRSGVREHNRFNPAGPRIPAPLLRPCHKTRIGPFRPASARHLAFPTVEQERNLLQPSGAGIGVKDAAK